MKLTPSRKVNRIFLWKTTWYVLCFIYNCMKLGCSNQNNRALTLVEVLVVIMVLAVLAAMLLPTLAAAKKKAQRISCVNNLKQIGVAFRVWEGDNGNKYPMDVSVTNGSTMELFNKGNQFQSLGFQNFLSMSNELNTPKIFHCPADTTGFAATNFSTGFNHQNISYFIGLDTNQDNPQNILSGDDNFEISGAPVKSGLLEISSNTPIAWSAARHKFSGNILLADASVQSLSNYGLTNCLHQTGLATNRFAIP